jgi:THAP4-like, heme-binding beta-barrel domain
VELSADLPKELVPLAWLIGHWEGAGVVGYPTIESANFGQELELQHDGRPFLSYRSQTWALDEAGGKVRPLATETGFWFPRGDGQLELVLTNSYGVAEIYVGSVEGPRVNLHTDLVARSPHSPEYTAATRMYGLVEGDLMWVLDMAAVGKPMQSHASAQLKRVG